VALRRKFMARTAFWETEVLRKERIEIVQINMGNRCNQTCTHCHIGASPRGDKNMDPGTAEKILDKLLSLDIDDVEFTGGTPEMNPNLTMFIEKLAGQGKRITVRTSLTVLDLPEYGKFMDLYRKHRVRLIASLPGAFEDQTDAQRGKGVFQASMEVLRKLNSIGYGKDGLTLDLVYNSAGDYLPPEQSKLEQEYKQLLKDRHGVSFSNLLTIVNTPIKRFRQYLITRGRLTGYMEELMDNFNPDTLERVMCRRLISVDYQGHVFDCDFNLALGIRIKNYEDKKLWDIDFSDFTPEITCDEHCYACTVNRGSSCQGALMKEENGSDVHPVREQFSHTTTSGGRVPSSEENTAYGLQESAPFFNGVKENVRHYYGEVVQNTADLKTTACCTPDAMPDHVRAVLPFIADEITERYYGCGSPIPIALKGLTVLDLGCGTGRDSYILSKLVGEKGFVHGIDMTEKQIRVAEKYLELQTNRFGYGQPNCRFIFDTIENFADHFSPASLDIVISNCVINLVEDKERVLRQVFAALKPGGEFYFSDIYADRRVPERVRKDQVLYGECLGGALYEKDFERMAKRSGFVDPRVVSKRSIGISNEEIRERIGNIRFSSVTYRLWKIEGLEDACEDYGHVAVYRGGITESPFRFELDAAHVFEKNRPERVCGNTALMLSRTRLLPYFEITGSFDEHFGLFRQCGTTASPDDGDRSLCC
jgi:radical SAM/Cys-rich protein